MKISKNIIHKLSFLLLVLFSMGSCNDYDLPETVNIIPPITDGKPLTNNTKTKLEGTTLIIEELREGWTEAIIKRIYRYVSDLFQPDYLSENSEFLNIAKQNKEIYLGGEFAFQILIILHFRHCV